jgi:hypothetical protein
MAAALKNFLFANLVTSFAEERGKGELGGGRLALERLPIA